MTQQIELTLSSDIVSVDGVVNGEGYAFALTGSANGRSTWSADVPRAEDDIYRIEITATNIRGAFSKLNTVIYYGLQLITDRTLEDVFRVRELARKGWANMTPEERAEWESGMKGAYNYTDLNRVQSAVRFLRDRLADAGYPITISDHKTWMANDVPTQSDIREYLADIRAIRSAISLPETTPFVPDTLARMSHVDANNLERILVDVDRFSANILPHVIQSGEIYGGEWQ